MEVPTSVLPSVFTPQTSDEVVLRSDDHAGLLGTIDPHGTHVDNAPQSRPISAQPFSDLKRKGTGNLNSFKIPKRQKVLGLSDSDRLTSSNEEFSSDEDRSFSDSDPDTDGLSENISVSHETDSDLIDKVKRFDPLATETHTAWALDPSQNEYVKKYFSQWLGDSAVKESILEKNPRPSMKAKALDLDPDMLELLPHGSQGPAKQTDFSFRRVQNRVLDIMGPLGRLWVTLEKVQSEGGKKCDLDQLILFTQQAVLMAGQANVLVNHNRRLNVLSRFFRDHKKASEVLTQNEELLRSNEKSLFGRDFFKALHRKAKGNKKSKEIRAELGSSSFKRGSTVRFHTHHPQTKIDKGHRHPFRKSLPSGQRGGGGPSRAGYKRSQPGRGAYKTKRYVFFTDRSQCSVNKSTSSRFRHKSHSGHRINGTSAHSRSEPKVIPGDNTLRGESAIFSPKLENNYTGPSSVTDSTRVQVGPGGDSYSIHKSPHAQFLDNRENTNRNRNTRIAGKTGNRDSSGPERSISESYFPPTQERWLVSASVQSEEVEHVRSIRTLQDGGHAHVGGYNNSKRLHVQNRFERRIFLHPSNKTTQTIPKISMGEQDIPIQSSRIRIGVGTKNLHKSVETHCECATSHRNPSDHLFGRYDPDESGLRRSSQGLPQCNLDVGTSGICGEQAKISDKSDTENRIPRVFSGLYKHETSITRGQSDDNTNSLCRFIKISPSLGSRASTGNRQTVSNNAGRASCTTALPPVANAENEGSSQGTPELWVHSESHKGVSGGVTLVDKLPAGLEWKSHYLTQPRSSDHDRFVKKGVGCSMSGSDNTRVVVATGSTETHKCARIDSSSVCNKELCEGQDTMSHSFEDRQWCYSSTDKQNGGASIDRAPGSHNGDLELLSVQTDHNYCRAPPRQVKRHCGQGVQNIHRYEQLETAPISLFTSGENYGTGRHRLVCRQDECSKDTLHELEARSGGGSHRCIQSELEQAERIRFSTHLPDWALLGQSSERTGNNNNSDSSVDGTNMVSHTIRNVNKPTHTITSTPTRVNVTTGEMSSHVGDRTPTIGGMESFRNRMEAQGFSNKSTNLLLQAWRPGTQSAYKGPWNKWVGWCGQRQINPLQASVELIANFLAEMFDNGLEYSTLNGYRSALSAFHPEIDNHKVGQHPLIKQVMQGVFNGRPPKPKYTDTWEVDSVLSFLKSLGNNSALNLKDLTIKLTMLLALTTAGRGSELKAIDLHYIMYKGDEIVCQIPGLTKSKRPNKPHVSLSLHKYDVDPSLDVTLCLKQYIDVTKPLRKSKEQETQLLIAIIKPHKPVATCSVARWIKMCLDRTGIDSSKYTAHSTRSATTSKAKAQGLSTEQIIERANWSKAATFYRFYHRETVQSSVFQSKVLSIKK